MKTILFASVAMLALAASAPAFAQTPPADKPAAAADKPAADKPAAAADKPAADKPAAAADKAVADKPAKPAKPAGPTPAPAAMKEHTLAGTVKSFDGDKHMLTFSSGKEFMLDTSITDTFKAGDKVSVHYTFKSGKRMADKVTKG